MFLAFDFAASLPMIAIILLAAGMLVAVLAAWAHAHNHAALAEDLDIAHEALDVSSAVAQLVSEGATLPEALAKVGPSPEAQNLIRRFRVFAHLSALLLAFCFFVGCASPAEDYVRAEAAAWAQFDTDNRLDRWIDSDQGLDGLLKDALHQLNKGRRARVAHALAVYGPPAATPAASASK